MGRSGGPQPRFLGVDVEDAARVLRPCARDQVLEGDGVGVPCPPQAGEQLAAHPHVLDARLDVGLADRPITLAGVEVRHPRSTAGRPRSPARPSRAAVT
ncbi:hypothetical protein [Candidatus Frankia alpina]|uniref:hypothetical protein n=1 Tax=Candidatus Frankia alpina TaxID=2699483 RepID=UPI001F4641D3|nr:hypothetical protein [Candidatus Frankia alpina]